MNTGRTIPSLSRLLAAVALLVAAALSGTACSKQEDAASSGGIVRIFAAASLTEVMGDLAAQYEAKSDVRVEVSTASSSTLARQIEEGAPADVFISANTEWMDYLQTRGLLNDSTRSNLLSNRLVLVASSDFTKDIPLDPAFDFAAAFEGRLAIGNPEHVPAGKYGKRALEALGWWEGVKDRLAPAADVKLALATVETGETPLGLVYATDARVSDVRLVAIFSPELSGSILYPVAALKDASSTAEGFLDFLHSAAAAEVFTAAGFTTEEQG